MLSPYRAAQLLIGLPTGSRTKKKISGLSYNTDQMLLALIADRLGWLCWSKTKDGKNNRNRPASILDQMTGKDKKSGEVVGFKTSEDFESAWKELTKEK